MRTRQGAIKSGDDCVMAVGVEVQTEAMQSEGLLTL